LRFCLQVVVLLVLAGTLFAEPQPLGGSLSMSDPSSIIKCGGRYYVFGSGQGVPSKASSDLLTWSDGPRVFVTAPAWTGMAVHGFTGVFRAPDIVLQGGSYRLYYAVTIPDSKVSAIGLATSPTLDPSDPSHGWTDQGMVVSSSDSADYSAVDPSVTIDPAGRHWLAFGAGGIKLIELDPATGQRISPNSPIFSLAFHDSIEAGCLIHRGEFYYLFVNWGTCCLGVNSTSNIRVGRSSSVTGPYRDANGTNMLNGGGTLYLTTQGRWIAPGQLGFLNDEGGQWICYHFYDGEASGAATLAIESMSWEADGWPAWKLPYQDTARPLEERVSDLLSRMTLEEKVTQMVNDSPAIERLGVPAYNWWNEALHGVAFSGIATVFPQAIGLGATFDTRLMGDIASVISDEARAKYHDYLSRGDRGIFHGLTFWSPNINIFRDPRWGRGQETYGEDPYLTSRLGVTFVRGLQGDDPRYLKLVATPKHYAVHSGPEPLRHSFDAIVDEQDLRQTYLPAFEACIREGGAFSIMTAYNRTNGEACSAHTRLLAEILRNEWGFDGYVVSDCGAVADIYNGHHLVNSLEAASALAVQRGCDLNCGDTYLNLVTGVRQGLISESDINRSLARLLEARFRLGMFDPDSRVSYSQIPISVNDSAPHRAIALEAARESIVLLKNEDSMLPLSKDLQSVAVIGPNADSWDVLLGNYSGWPSSAVTPLQGIRAKLPGAQLLYAKGSQIAEALEVIPSTALFTSSAPGARSGLNAAYFSNRYLSGLPTLTRVDSQVDFSWWGSPADGLPADNFSIRWTGKLRVPLTGVYQVGARGDDGYRLYVNGQVVAEDWTDHGATTRFKEMYLVAGRYYDIQLDYYEASIYASVQLLWKPPADALRAEAVEAASQSDLVIMVMGISPRLEGEEMSVQIPGFSGGDRTDLGLPETQEDLLKAVQATGKPVVLVLLSGSSIAVNWASDNVPAILQAWYPGEEGGTAIADVLFGDYNPGGRLPVTVYESANQLPPFGDYNMAGRTYRYFEGDPLYPFGYGLSYSSFSYRGLTISPPDSSREREVSVVVSNDGPLEGDEVVQLYVADEQASVPVPIRSLQGFTRVRLAAGESRTVRFKLTPGQLSIFNNQGQQVVERGTFVVSVGGKQPGFHGKADASTTQVLTARFTFGRSRWR
jgi:beta-glucosidase